MDMKGRFRIFYDFASYRSDHPYEAHIQLNNDVFLIESGSSFEEAKQKVVERARQIPEDETVEII
jgi:hypothetical protein